MDGDLQHSPIDILKLLKVYENKKADFVIGTRKLFERKKHNLGFLRLSASRLLNINCKYFFRTKNLRSNEWFFYF